MKKKKQTTMAASIQLEDLVPVKDVMGGQKPRVVFGLQTEKTRKGKK